MDRSERLLTAAGLALALGAAGPTTAGEADVVAASASRDGEGTWRFDVTVRHNDKGWDHYADRWEVRTLDGSVLATRTLLHPHDTEQPFTRSLVGVVIPADTAMVEIRAHDNVHGFGGAVVRVRLGD